MSCQTHICPFGHTWMLYQKTVSWQNANCPIHEIDGIFGPTEWQFGNRPNAKQVPGAHRVNYRWPYLVKCDQTQTFAKDSIKSGKVGLQTCFRLHFRCYNFSGWAQLLSKWNFLGITFREKSCHKSAFSRFPVHFIVAFGPAVHSKALLVLL